MSGNVFKLLLGTLQIPSKKDRHIGCQSLPTEHIPPLKIEVDWPLAATATASDHGGHNNAFDSSGGGGCHTHPTHLFQRTIASDRELSSSAEGRPTHCLAEGNCQRRGRQRRPATVRVRNIHSSRYVPCHVAASCDVPQCTRHRQQ